MFANTSPMERHTFPPTKWPSVVNSIAPNYREELEALDVMSVERAEALFGATFWKTEYWLARRRRLLARRQLHIRSKRVLNRDYDAFKGEIPWCGRDMSLSLEVNVESKPSWTRARSVAKKLLVSCETWDTAMRKLAAKILTELANNWLSQDEANPHNPETAPHYRGRTCPATQHEKPVRHIRRQLHRLV